MYVYVHMCATGWAQRPKDNLAGGGGSGLSFYHVDRSPGQTQIMRRGSRCHYTLNHCSSPKQFYCISYKFSLLKDPLCSSSEIRLLGGLQCFLPL